MRKFQVGDRVKAVAHGLAYAKGEEYVLTAVCDARYKSSQLEQWLGFECQFDEGEDADSDVEEGAANWPSFDFVLVDIKKPRNLPEWF